MCYNADESWKHSCLVKEASHKKHISKSYTVKSIDMKTILVVS